MQNENSFLVNVKRILWWFELTSRLKVNFHKSSLVGISLDEDYITGMANVIYYKWDRYLGLPLGANPKRISTWKLVVSKFCTRLGRWKGGFLNLYSRTCLPYQNYSLHHAIILYISVFVAAWGC